MNNHQADNIEQTPDERFAAIANLKGRLEADFVQLGWMLSTVKRRRTYKLKGYKTFKEFLDNEYNMATALANRLVGVYDVFVKQQDMDDNDLLSIGFDKLTLIKPYVGNKNTLVADQEYWIEQAKNLSVEELKELIADTRLKSIDKTPKEIFTEQFTERMVTLFNCSAKELQFKLALYFQDADEEGIQQTVRTKQRRFEEGVL